MKWKSNLFRGLAGVFLALTVMLSCASSVANSWQVRVNELLGVTSSVQRSEDAADYQYVSDYSSGSELIDAEIALNTRLEAEGAVSLKGTPAVDGKNVTLFGMRSGENMQFGGSMGSLVDESNVVTLAEALTDNGFSVNEKMVDFYKDADLLEDYAPTKAAGGNVVDMNVGSAINEVPVSEYSGLESTYGDYKDAAIIVLGRDAGESCCFYPGEEGTTTFDKDDKEHENPIPTEEFLNSSTGNILGLSDDERDLVHYVEEQGFSKVIVLLNSAVPMEVEELKTDDGVNGILWIGNPGAYGTYGIAKLLSGEVLPSGHLPDTYAVNSALSPAMQNYGVYLFDNADAIETTTNHGLRSDWYLAEEEGIYIGYKYYETRYADSVLGQGNASVAQKGETVDGGTSWDYNNEVSYTFGYGLEGSSFSEEITDMSIDWSGEKKSSATVNVTNTGDVAAKHAVQLYVSLPYTDYDKANGIEKSAIQLVGFGKTGEASEKSYEDCVLLAPGESEEVTIEFLATDLYSYDMSYEHDGTKGAYLLEEGDYYFA
ncbi:MAG: glycoside hydrolase family 3 C-terminal domain-containing protein, partial [Lachnospiraceae bacterium]|nr:glycoside hydrolase family 3 C-terminal domain-containing protein [Lachnospiraceae bacterium]